MPALLPDRRYRLQVMLACFSLWLVSGAVRADEVASALYVRTDSDHTTVISPRVRGTKRLGEASTLDVSYAADIWTSASIDIRASASVRPVTEQRDELNVKIGHDLQDLRLRGSYRFSSEHDPNAFQRSCSVRWEAARRSPHTSVSGWLAATDDWEVNP